MLMHKWCDSKRVWVFKTSKYLAPLFNEMPIYSPLVNMMPIYSFPFGEESKFPANFVSIIVFSVIVLGWFVYFVRCQ